MSVATFEVVRYLDDLLRKDEFKDFTHNGLQVEGAPEISKVGVAVDACMATFEDLADCGMILVHHGLWWPSVDRITAADRRRLAFLLGREINLYVSHLPMDRHPQLGNNAVLLRGLGLEPAREFGEVGWVGEFDTPVPREDLLLKVQTLLEGPVRTLDFGSPEISSLAVCSGSGGVDYMLKACDLGADAYLTGEASHAIYHAAREAGMNVLLGGHYATETWGVKALCPLLQEAFGLETRFAAQPTGF
ncbi:MAG: Nif3-like dinuclear metal center hexameric protein [Candidatus Xenobium sp.]|jgi:dinuclear metal center YbgI/SA1388 family protein|nr:Nif3-like dinuclear metal center hexameric protein [Burkholderiales bacterium]